MLGSHAGRGDNPKVLSDVTALLSTPAIIGWVVGALGAPAIAEAPVSAESAWVSVSDAEAPEASAPLTDPAALAVPVADVPDPLVGPQPGAAPTRTLAANTLLSDLTGLRSVQLATLAVDSADFARDVLAAPPAAGQVAGMWATASAADRTQLVSGMPQLVGNLEGVPYAIRDLANRSYLQVTIAEIRAQLEAGVGRAAAAELEARLHMLAEVAEALEPGPSGEPRTLVSLDVSGEGTAVVAIGDLSSASHVSILVPGMYFGVDAQLVDWASTADAMLVEQVAWADRLGLEPDFATVAWIGYHTPTLVSVASLELAEEGRVALGASLEGITAVRADDPPFLSVLAHSYGSTAAALALQEGAVAVDALAMVGSPGSPATSSADLAVRAGNVWAASASWDPVTGSGLFGAVPTDAEYGAHRFGVSDVADPVTGSVLPGIVSHNDYFTPGSSSMRNMALIALGHGELVLDDSGRYALAAQKSLARG